MKNKKLLVGLVAFSLLVFFGLNAEAAEFKIGEQGNTTINEKGLENLYTAGNIVSINSDIEKDLTLAGNMVTINSDIGDDLLMAGNTIMIRGKIGGNLRAVGGNIIINGEVNEDVIMFGANISFGESASIKGDLIIFGGNVEINCPVNGKLQVSGGKVVLNNEVKEDVKIKADELTIKESAILNGNLDYKGAKEADIDENAKIKGEVNFQKIETSVSKKAPKKLFGILTLGFLLKLLTNIAVGLVLVYLLRKLIEPIIKQSLTKFWQSAGIGIAGLILIPIVCIILFITVIGSLIGVIILPAYVLSILLASVLASITFGSWLIKVIGKKGKYEIDWKSVVIGVIVLSIICLIPVIGWIVKFIFMLIGLGAMYKLFKQAAFIKT